MVVVAFVVVLTAVALPLLTSRVGPAQLQAAAETVSATAKRGQASAQRDARPVRLFFRSSEDGRWTLRSESAPSADAWTFDALLNADGGADWYAGEAGGMAGSPAGEDTDFGGFADERDESDASGTRIIARFGRGLAVRTSPPLDPAEGEDPGRWPGDAPPLAGTSPQDDAFDTPAPAFLGDDVAGEESRELTLVVYLPDGGTLVANTVYLVTERGGAIKLDVNRWTGRVTMTPVERAIDRDDPYAFEDPEAVPAEPQQRGLPTGDTGREGAP